MTSLSSAISMLPKALLQLGLYCLEDQFLCAGLQQLAQWINTRFSTFQFNNVTLVHGGVSFWLFDRVVTSNQPDTPPFFNRLNTIFDNNSNNTR